MILMDIFFDFTTVFYDFENATEVEFLIVVFSERITHELLRFLFD